MWIRLEGRAEQTLAVFGEPEAPALVGAYALEGLRLAADPVGRRVTPVPGLLLSRGAGAARNPARFALAGPGR